MKEEENQNVGKSLRKNMSAQKMISNKILVSVAICTFS